MKNKYKNIFNDITNATFLAAISIFIIELVIQYFIK